MCALVDIQMPIKNESKVRGDVIGAFLNQAVDWEIYINLEKEIKLPSEIESSSDSDYDKDIREILKLTAESQKDISGIRERIQIARKRNALIDKGESPYIYLADADVLLNDDENSDVFNDVFGELVMGLERHPRLGAVGLPYLPAGYHVGAGSMMLRRNDLQQIGEIRGAGSFCTCGYITHRLLLAGLYTVSLRTRAKHLKVHDPIDPETKPKIDKIHIDIKLPDSLPDNIKEKASIGGSIYWLTKGEMMDLLKSKTVNNIGKNNMTELSKYEITFLPGDKDINTK